MPQKKQTPLYLTPQQKQALDNIYVVIRDDKDGDLTYQQFLRALIMKGANYYKAKYKIQDNAHLPIIDIKQTKKDYKKMPSQSIYTSESDNYDFDIDEITGGRI